MAYNDVYLLSVDLDFQHRVAACGATEHVAENADQWAFNHRWEMAAAPGFADAYASALAGGVPSPGLDPSVISDAQILAAVQAITAPAQVGP